MTRLITVLMLALGSANAMAGPTVAAMPHHSTVRFMLNRGDEAARKARLGTQVTLKKLNILRGVYDVAVNGGVTAHLKDVDGKDALLPAGAIIKNVAIHAATSPTASGAATVSFDSVAAADLKAATVITSLTGIVPGVPQNNTTGSWIVLAGATTIRATVASGPLTAGKFNVLVEYYLPQNE